MAKTSAKKRDTKTGGGDDAGWLDDVREKLALLAALDPERQTFGADAHDYTLARPLTAKALAAFEARLGVALPAAYRTFVSALGAGGAGPMYGLVPPSSRSLSLLPKPKAKKGAAKVVPDPARAFPFADPAGGDPPALAAGTALHDGCVFLADEGCGYFHVLVVSGPRRGAVWGDYREADEGLWELAPSFDVYYRAWLDQALAECLGAAAEAAIVAGAASPHDALLRANAERVLAAPKTAADKLRASYVALYVGRDTLAKELAAAALAQAPNAPAAKVALARAWADDVAKARGPAPDPTLARHTLAFVRRALVANPAAPVAVLEAVIGHGLAHPDDPEAYIDLAAAARSPSLPAAHLAALVATRDGAMAPWVRRAAVLNPRLDAATLAELAADPDPAVRQAVALNARTTPRALAALAADRDGIVRRAAARHASTPTAALEALARDDDDMVLAALIENPAAPVSALVRATGPRASLDELVRRHWPRLPEPVRAALRAHPSWEDELEQTVGQPAPVYKGVVPDDDAGAEAILDPRDERHPWYRHPGYPVPLLPRDLLALDDLAALSVAHHPWAPPDVLRTLAAHRYSYVQQQLAQHPATPPDVLAALAAHRDPHVVHLAASNPRFPVASLAAVAAHEDGFAREGAARHPGAPRALLEALAADEDDYARRGVGRNPRAAPELLVRLAQDESENNRAFMLDNPALPEEARAILEADASARVSRGATWLRVQRAWLAAEK